MNKRILLIDDDESVRNAFALALRSQPYDLDQATCGDQGVEKIQQADYDLVYLDLRMPGIDGVETLRRIRAVKPDQLVYIVTAFHREFLADLVSARHAGLQFELLSKPLERRQIIDITRGILGSTAAVISDPDRTS
ncbi:MAG TPA: response regulator [Chromatiaceae bacterium]|jgi:DNA-binding response OmpR family regulator|nr:MAG: hypothetical protein N838_03985 [Thiohalocapsa sp. PB-PSB1]QQO55868.1 MAG: response regulator [Thiohalocapsa sp. PB-PSB1]HBG95127.1 response regulator [Chromatiaceae bacterium]HCS90763.1 response regulator [Chromatiaceae bacterium]